MTAAGRKVWIDLDNSPHVPFFRPVADELRRRGHAVAVSARDAFQVTALAQLHGVECATIGRHYGRNRLLKIAGVGVRAAQLLPFAVRERPVLAVSHGSRAQLLAARSLGIPSVVLADYEHVTHVSKPEWMIVPAVMPVSEAARFARNVLQYPGIKEDVYACTFRPNPGVRDILGLAPEDLVVVVRPPATEAHYHNPESEALLGAVLELVMAVPAARVVLLPRNARQQTALERQWAPRFSQGRIIVPQQTIDGLDLVWLADLVISGGGTMNREAAALGVPVYSIFRGAIGAVDRYLSDAGRLVLLTSADDARQRLRLVHRDRGHARPLPARAALDTIVEHLCGLLDALPASRPTLARRWAPR